MERALKRVAAIKQASPLESDTMIGAQASSEQMEKSSATSTSAIKKRRNYFAAANARTWAANSKAATTCSRPSSAATIGMRIFQKKSSPRRLCHNLKTEADALEIAKRHALWSGAGCGAATPTSAINGPRHPGGRVWVTLSRLSGTPPRSVDTTVGHRPRDPQHDARPLPADQEPARQLQPQEAWILLGCFERRKQIPLPKRRWGIFCNLLHLATACRCATPRAPGTKSMHGVARRGNVGKQKRPSSQSIGQRVRNRSGTEILDNQVLLGAKRSRVRIDFFVLRIEIGIVPLTSRV